MYPLNWRENLNKPGTILEAYHGDGLFSFFIEYVYDEHPIEIERPCGIIVRGFTCGIEVSTDSLWGIEDNLEGEELDGLARVVLDEAEMEAQRVVLRIRKVHRDQ